MRSNITGLIVVASVIAAVVTEFLVFSTVQQADAGISVLAAPWLAAPYLAAIGLALLFRQRSAPLITLLVVFLLAAGLGLTLFGNGAANQAAAEEQVRNAVQPGEDPSRGPAAHRKTGADIGADITWGVMVLLAVVVPPVQFGLIVIPTLIAFAIAAATAHRKEPEAAEPLVT